MVKLNTKLNNLKFENSFQMVSKKVSDYKKLHPDINLISLGIGDVSRPIVKPVIDEMLKAVKDLEDIKTFKGYGAYYGYDFLKEVILKNEYQKFNISLDEIYISNGAKTDTTSILELFDLETKILLTSPMYPIYEAGCKALGRDVTIMDLYDEEFNIKVPEEHYDIIYLCSPNNPLGIHYKKDNLEKIVEYALKNNSVILYDNVYHDFVESKNALKSIYEINDAKKVAIEFRSFSKNASFTGVRCSYFVIPHEISPDINSLWQKRTINRFNGADYIAQRGAWATFLPDAKKLIKENINYYKENSNYLRKALEKFNYQVLGGIDSPFMWVKTKNKNSWEEFDFFLEQLNIIIIPGIVFGEKGDNYFRVSALGTRESIKEAIKRMEDYYEEKK